MQTAANKGALLALVAMAQTFVVLTAGIDLSVGMVFVLTNCLASWIVVGSPADGVARRRRRSRRRARLAARSTARSSSMAACSRSSTTIATGAIYFGIALALRPVPGGDVNSDLSDALTGRVFGVVPASLVALTVRCLVIWIPFRRSAHRARRLCRRLVGGGRLYVGRAGPPAKFLAYVVSGLVASVGGLFLTFITASGEASAANGGSYTLYSIAAVVLGGVSLFGGSGSALGAIFGALMFRTIGDLLFVFDLDPLWQPLFQGVVLLRAVCLGSVRLFQIRNRLDLFE